MEADLSEFQSMKPSTNPQSKRFLFDYTVVSKHFSKVVKKFNGKNPDRMIDLLISMTQPGERPVCGNTFIFLLTEIHAWLQANCGELP